MKRRFCWYKELVCIYPHYYAQFSREELVNRNQDNKFSAMDNETAATGGHFARACVHPLNDNSVGALNLMARSRNLA